jgi:alcohol dehydrogenase (NADP+)
MLCGGITTFSPLLQHSAGPGKKVGIIGIGGLGHFGILGAKALGCDEIVAISRTRTKKEDAMKMGATKFIATEEDHDWASSNAGTLDLIISTVSSPNMPIQEYLGLLRLNGQFVQVGAPEDKIPGFNSKFQNSSQMCHPFADWRTAVFALILKRCGLAGSLIGPPREIRQMLDLFAKKGVRTWNNNVPMKDANKAIIDMHAGKARYRYVLVNEENVTSSRQ